MTSKMFLPQQLMNGLQLNGTFGCGSKGHCYSVCLSKFEGVIITAFWVVASNVKITLLG